MTISKVEFQQFVCSYKIASPVRITIEDKTVEGILEKIQDLEAYKLAYQYRNEKSDSALEWLKRKILEGTCHGEAAALLDLKLEEAQIFSLQNRLNSIDPAEVIFRQVVSEIKPWTKPETSSIFYQRELDDLIAKWNPNKESTCKINLLSQQRRLQEQKMIEQESLLNEWEPLAFGREWDSWYLCSLPNVFCADLAPEFYRKHLENAIEKASLTKNQQIRGVINLLGHVMTFQYGPQEYFIYDPYSKSLGLFKFLDEESFFKGMRLLVQQFMDSEKISSELAVVFFEIYAK